MYQLMKYEDIAVAYYADQDYNKRILTHPTAEDLKDKLGSNLKKVKNPYSEAYLWIKGEFLYYGVYKKELDIGSLALLQEDAEDKELGLMMKERDENCDKTQEEQSSVDNKSNQSDK